MTTLPSTAPGTPQELLALILGLLADYRYLVIFLGAAIDFLLPNSGDLVVLAGGWLSNTPTMNLGLVALIGAGGALISDNTMYWTGRLGGRRFVLHLLRTNLPTRFRAPGRFRWVESRVRKHGGKVILVGRLIPGFRGSVPLCAGVMRLPYTRFLAFNVAAVSLWAVVVSSIGFLFGQYWAQILQAARWLGLAVLAVLLLLLVRYLYRAYRDRQPPPRVR